MLLSGSMHLTACLLLSTIVIAVGNRRFRHIIADAIDDYNLAGSRKAKSTVVKRVHDAVGDAF
jgi:hypothetical protein